MLLQPCTTKIMSTSMHRRHWLFKKNKIHSVLCWICEQLVEIPHFFVHTNLNECSEDGALTTIIDANLTIVRYALASSI